MRRTLYLSLALMAAVCLAPLPARAQTLDEIIGMNLKAKGGLETLKATTTVRMTGHMTAKDAAGQEVKGTMTTLAKRPNMMRREALVGGQKIVNAFDGNSLWMAVGTMPPQQAPGPQAAYARQDAEFDSVFVDYKAKGHSIQLVGKENLDGKPAFHLKVIKKGGPPQDYYLDAATGLERKITLAMDQGQLVVTELSDYRSVDGRMVPFGTRQSINGQQASAVTIDTIEFNLPVDDSVFRMPSSK
jgi:outer membrane lipoprotein-sorting protein